MNQDQSGLTLEESIKQVMQTLPPIIRDYLSQGKYTPVAKDMMAKYGLRIDQGGVLEREIMLLLMGIEDPAEFSKTLAEEARLDQKTVNDIMQDINEQIFIPLREEMRKRPVTVPASNIQQQQKFFHLQNKISPPRHQNLALRDALATVTKISRPLESGKLLEDHEEPHIEFNKAPTVHSIVVSPAPSKAPTLPAPQRIATPSKPIIKTEPEAKPKLVTPTAAPAKPYSIDPYREPIDEK